MPTNQDTVDAYIEAERQPHREPSVRITGLMIQYLHTCERELWFMSRGIDIDRDAANIRRGERIDETSYRDQRNSFQIDGRIQLDLLDDGRVMEVKASSTLEEPARMQLLYYLWYLDRIHDVHREGVLAYPAERTRKQVTLDEEAADKVEVSVRRTIEVVQSSSPPPLEKKPYCDACLYQDLCWM